MRPVVSADAAARFLSLKRRYVLALARRGISGAYPLGIGTKRKVWVFRLSELADAIAGKDADSSISKSANSCTIESGSPR